LNKFKEQFSACNPILEEMLHENLYKNKESNPSSQYFADILAFCTDILVFCR